jgi:hypothetical protein
MPTSRRRITAVCRKRFRLWADEAMTRGAMRPRPGAWRQVEPKVQEHWLPCRNYPGMANDQGIVKDQRGQEQPKDKERAQGLKEQREAVEREPQSPGEPAEK